MKHVKIEQPPIMIKSISDYPLEDQIRWANIKPYRPVKTLEIDTLAPQTKRRGACIRPPLTLGGFGRDEAFKTKGGNEDDKRDYSR